MPDFSQLIDRGKTAEVYHYRDNQILKLFALDRTPQKVSDEFQKSQIIFKSGVDIPEPKELVTIDNRLGIVSQFIAGTSMKSLLLKKPWMTLKWAQLFAQKHAELHTVSVPTLTPLNPYLKREIMDSEQLSKSTKDHICGYLDTLPDGQTLYHGDFHPGNLLCNGTKTYIIDWVAAAAGNPCADVAMTELLLNPNFCPPEMSSLKRIVYILYKTVFLKLYLKYYLQYTPYTLEDIQAWYLPVAASALKYCKGHQDQFLLKRIDHYLKLYTLN